jgi:hypothetical protein
MQKQDKNNSCVLSGPHLFVDAFGFLHRFVDAFGFLHRFVGRIEHMKKQLYGV